MMRRLVISMFCFAAASSLLSGCDRSVVRGRDDNASKSVSSIKPEPAPSPPITTALSAKAYERSVYLEGGSTTGLERTIASINSVSLDVFEGGSEDIMIQAAGMVSGDWFKPTLVPIEDEPQSESTRKFRFVAIPGNRSEQEEQRAIYVRLRTEIPRSVKTIEIVTEENRISVAVVRPDPAPSTSAADSP